MVMLAYGLNLCWMSLGTATHSWPLSFLRHLARAQMLLMDGGWLTGLRAAAPCVAFAPVVCYGAWLGLGWVTGARSFLEEVALLGHVLSHSLLGSSSVFMPEWLSITYLATVLTDFRTVMANTTIYVSMALSAGDSAASPGESQPD